MSEAAMHPLLVSAPREVDERPRRRSVVALVTAAMFLDAVFFALIAPLLPEYSEQLSLTRLQVGLLFAAHPAGTLIFAPIAAVMVRRIGTRVTMVVGLVALGVATIVFGFAGSLALLAGCRFVQGASAALVWCGGLARLRDVTPPERRGTVLGLAGSAAGAGSLFGPALAGLGEIVPIELVLLTLGIIALGLCAALFSAGEVHGEGEGSSVEEPGLVGGSGRLYGMLRPVVVIVVCGTVFGAVATLAPLRLDDLGLGVAAIAAIFSIAAIAEMIVSPLAGHYSDRVGRVRPIRLCLVFAIPLLALQGEADVAWLVALAVPFTGAAMASLWPLGTALLADESGDRHRSPAGAFAASIVSWSSGLVVGSLLCSALAQAAGETVAYGALIAACALALLVLSSAPATAARISR
jgi:MFS family permease